MLYRPRQSQISNDNTTASYPQRDSSSIMGTQGKEGFEKQ